MRALSASPSHGPICLRTGGLEPFQIHTQLCFRGFSSSSRCGPQASEITKHEPQATAQGGCVTATNQPPSLRDTQETAPSPCLECVPAREGIGSSGRVGGRLDRSPPTPFPFQFPVLLPSSPPCWAFPPSPSARAPWKTRSRRLPRLGFPKGLVSSLGRWVPQFGLCTDSGGRKLEQEGAISEAGEKRSQRLKTKKRLCPTTAH